MTLLSSGLERGWMMHIDDAADHVFQRIDRIELKLDKLTDAVTSLARIEERLTAHMEGVKKLEDRIDKLEGRLSSIDQLVDDLERSKVHFATLVGVVSGAVSLFAPFVLKYFFGVG